MEIYLFIATLVLSAFFSGSETAFITANRLKLIASRDADKRAAWYRIIQNENRFLSTTLVGNNIVMVSCSSLAVVIFSAFTPDSILVIVTTLFLLTFGEVLPKSVAQQIPNRAFRITPFLMTLFFYLLYPLVWLSQRFAQLLLNFFYGKSEPAMRLFSRVELPLLVQKDTLQKSSQYEAGRLISRVVKTSEKRLDDIMIPRIDIKGVDANASLDEIVTLFQSSGLSRIVVYQDDIDHVLGFIFLLDLLTKDSLDLQTIIRPPLFFPENSTLKRSLKEMQRDRKSIAIVVDEHGGTAGLITLEDMIEELVGRITDEFDPDYSQGEWLKPKTLFVHARIELDELEEVIDMKLTRGDYVTLGGLIQAQLGRIPKPGDEFVTDQIQVKIISADKRKINKIILQLP